MKLGDAECRCLRELGGYQATQRLLLELASVRPHALGSAILTMPTLKLCNPWDVFNVQR